MSGATQCVYDLYGVVNHLGMLGAGHYVAYCISPTTGRYDCLHCKTCTCTCSLVRHSDS